jgi:hypothetical protein
VQAERGLGFGNGYWGMFSKYMERLILVRVEGKEVARW